jgi:hypothetical protein
MLLLCCAHTALAQAEAAPVTPAPALIPPGVLSPLPGSESPGSDALLDNDTLQDSCATPLTDPPVEQQSSAQSCVRTLDEFWGCRSAENGTSWIVGDGNPFGDFTLKFDHDQLRGIKSGVGVRIAFHFLAGPAVTDMPARLFDFSTGTAVSVSTHRPSAE